MIIVLVIVVALLRGGLLRNFAALKLRWLPDVAKIEELLSQVCGVMAVRVVQDEQGQIDELHIVGSPGRSAKQMVRAVESLLYVRGVRLDHRKISWRRSPSRPSSRRRCACGG